MISQVADVPPKERQVIQACLNRVQHGWNSADARAYAAWAGKRLCGRIGGGPIATSGNGPFAARAARESD